jgi:5'-nucleotidase
MSKDDRPLVLLTNDDGIASPGLAALERALAPSSRVFVVAPETEQSACSHALTLHRALRLRVAGPQRYALDGTPADCVYVALFAGKRLMPRRPDVVISGINRGPNLGFDIYYSGTVAAAREAAIRGVPAIAASADFGTDLDAASAVCGRIARAVVREARPRSGPVLLNVNFPAGARWDPTATSIGRRIYGEGVDFRVDPRGREYLWIGAPGVSHDAEPGTDTEAYERGEVGVSSLSLVPQPGAADALSRKIVLFLRKEPAAERRMSQDRPHPSKPNKRKTR